MLSNTYLTTLVEQHKSSSRRIPKETPERRRFGECTEFNAFLSNINVHGSMSILPPSSTLSSTSSSTSPSLTKTMIFKESLWCFFLQKDKRREWHKLIMFHNLLYVCIYIAFRLENIQNIKAKGWGLHSRQFGQQQQQDKDILWGEGFVLGRGKVLR